MQYRYYFISQVVITSSFSSPIDIFRRGISPWKRIRVRVVSDGWRGPIKPTCFISKPCTDQRPLGGHLLNCCWCHWWWHRKRGWRHVIVGIAKEIGIGRIKLLLEPLNLSLQKRDGSYAPINWVSHTCLSFIGKRVHCIFPLVWKKLVQKLRHIARSEYLVHVRELLRLFWWEVRCKDAP